MDDNQLKPWDRLSDENERDYDMFRSYLELRTYKAVARKFSLAGEQVDVLFQYIKHHAAPAHKWNQRKDAYDRWIAKTRDDALAAMVQTEVSLIGKQRITLIRRLWRIMDKVGKKIEDKLDRKGGELAEDDFRLGDVYTLFTLAEKLNNIWIKLEASNPAGLSADKPFEQEVIRAKDNMKERLALMRDAAKRPTAKGADIVQ